MHSFSQVKLPVCGADKNRVPAYFLRLSQNSLIRSMASLVFSMSPSIGTMISPTAASKRGSPVLTPSPSGVLEQEVYAALVAIGNAPTALFHLLELLDQGAPKPAVILGFPVGFVGAAESKAELAERPRGCDFVALRGRRGGSAMASAAVNALAVGLPEDRARKEPTNSIEPAERSPHG